METRLAVIGVAYDGSNGSQAALELAVALATPQRATVRLIGVFERPHPVAVGFPGAMTAPVNTADSVRDSMYERLRAAADSVPAELRPDVVVVEGQPSKSLLSQTETLDLIVCGSHGYGPVRRALLGSVSTALAHRAACPVLIARHADCLAEDAPPLVTPAATMG